MRDLNRYALKIIELLEIEYPDAMCTLDFETPWQLLFSTRLAAQCTDERVNMVTPELFRRYPTLESFASADIADIEDLIHSCGFYHVKARDIVACAGMLINEYGGEVPDTMEELLKLPGVGRKTASIILGDVYNKPAVVTDTHCIRLANRMGFTVHKDPYKVEISLAAVIPPEKQSNFCHRLVLHGRAVCSARKPKCEACTLSHVCEQKI